MLFFGLILPNILVCGQLVEFGRDGRHFLRETNTTISLCAQWEETFRELLGF